MAARCVRLAAGLSTLGLGLVLAPAVLAEPPTSRTVIGIEPDGDVSGAVAGAIQAVGDRQTRLEAALREVDRRVGVTMEAAQATEARLARGDDPLVALEIEQLWSVVESLERENALLRERLDVLEAAAGEGGE